MTIEIHQPRLEALIEKSMASGQFESIEDFLFQTLDAATCESVHKKHDDPKAEPKKQNLADFLLSSPLHGSGLVIERSKDAPRIIEF